MCTSLAQHEDGVDTFDIGHLGAPFQINRGALLAAVKREKEITLQVGGNSGSRRLKVIKMLFESKEHE